MLGFIRSRPTGQELDFPSPVDLREMLEVEKIRNATRLWETPDGRLAAYTFGSLSQEENELTGLKIGYADPVGAHPDFQRRGLSRALLLECLERLREQGMQFARLGTGSWKYRHAACSRICWFPGRSPDFALRIEGEE